MDRNCRQACQLTPPSVNSNIPCTILAPPTRTHCFLYSVGDSIPIHHCHLMTLLGIKEQSGSMSLTKEEKQKAARDSFWISSSYSVFIPLHQQQHSSDEAQGGVLGTFTHDQTNYPRCICPAVNSLDRYTTSAPPAPVTGRNPATEKNPSFVRTSQSLSCHYTAKT